MVFAAPLIFLVFCISLSRSEDTPSPFENPPTVEMLGAPFEADKMQLARITALSFHNMLREWHNAPLMILDDELNEQAQNASEWNARWGKAVLTSYYETPVNEKWEKPNHDWDVVNKTTHFLRNFYGEICDGETKPWSKGTHYRFMVSKFFTKLGMGAAQNGDKKSFHITFRYGLSDPNTDCQYSYSSKTECVEGPRCDWKAQVCVGSKAENGKFETLLKPDLYDNSCMLDTLGPDAWTAFVNGTAA